MAGSALFYTWPHTAVVLSGFKQDPSVFMTSGYLANSHFSLGANNIHHLIKLSVQGESLHCEGPWAYFIMTFTQRCNDANITQHHCRHAHVWLWKPNIVTFRCKWLLIIVTTGSRTGWLDIWCFCPLLHWSLIGQERNWHFGGISDLSFKWLINSLSMPDICLLAAIFHLHAIIGRERERNMLSCVPTEGKKKASFLNLCCFIIFLKYSSAPKGCTDLNPVYSPVMSPAVEVRSQRSYVPLLAWSLSCICISLAIEQ